MSFTCYANLVAAGVGSNGPPAQISLTADYFIVDTTTNTAVAGPNGVGDSVTVLLSTPITKQADLLPSVQAAIQAQETGHPSLAFIWVGL